MSARKLYESTKASFGVNASVPGPTGVRAKALPGSKTQGDAKPPKQGSSQDPDYEDQDTPGQKQAKSPGAGADGKIMQGSSSISQPPQVTSEDLDISADVEAIFEGADLSEDFKAKASNIFETAVVSIVNEKLNELSEEMLSELDAARDSLAEEMQSQLDQYLDYVVEQWMEDNRLAIESGVRAEIAENFLQGLRSLFAESYVDVPEEKAEILDDLVARMEELEAALNEQLETNVELNTRLGAYERGEAFQEVAEGLTDTQVAKLENLAEGLNFTDPDEFRGKLTELRESYFPTGIKRDRTASFDDEDPIDLNEENQAADPSVRAAVQAISRTVKR